MFFFTIEVEIYFAGNDFRANEDPDSNPDGTGNMPVRVRKSLQIANPIVLDVIPLTVEMAMANSPPVLPANISVNNTFSPPFAGNMTNMSPLIFNFEIFHLLFLFRIE